MKLLLVGNFGVGNLGDEALRQFFLERFSEHQWIVLSASPSPSSEVPRLPLGLRSLFTPWWKTLRAFRSVDGVVFGGGSLFTDVESAFACVLWWWHVVVARFYGKPRYFAFQGVGPLTTPIGRFFAKAALCDATFLSVRDETSAQCAAQLTHTPIVRSADPVTLLLPRTSVRGDGVLLLPRSNSGSSFFSRSKALLEELRPPWVRIVLLQPELEQQIAEQLKILAAGRKAEIVPVRTLHELVAAFANASCALCERYHGALTALLLGIPFHILSQGEGDKLSSLRPGEANPSYGDTLVNQARLGEAALKDALLSFRRQ